MKNYLTQHGQTQSAHEVTKLIITYKTVNRVVENCRRRRLQDRVVARFPLCNAHETAIHSQYCNLIAAYLGSRRNHTQCAVTGQKGKRHRHVVQRWVTESCVTI